MFNDSLKDAARKSIPRGFRKSYIPPWDETYSLLYDEYAQADTPEQFSSAATNLINHLNARRQEKWTQSITDIDFTHSSRKTWNKINNLIEKKSVKKVCPISANLIANQVIRNGKFPNPD